MKYSERQLTKDLKILQKEAVACCEWRETMFSNNNNLLNGLFTDDKDELVPQDTFTHIVSL